ncbi:MAG: hypothetical protein LKM45_06130 [Wolbachia endosymbiont of Alcedoecus sp.]|nr:hypothetical protein [Wolbachia endosymbiont of Alcedoecus sp.]
MTEAKNTSQENVEKKFKDVFGRSPGAFPEDTSLEEKVNYIAKGTKALKAVKSEDLENKIKNIVKLDKELKKQQRQNEEEVDKLRRSAQELRKEFGTSKKSRPGDNDKSPQEAGLGTQTTEASTQTDTQPPRVEELRNNPEFQEAASNLKETTAKGEKFGRSEQKEAFEAYIQTDTQPPISSEAQTSPELESQAVSPIVSKDSAELAETLGKTPAKDKSFKRSGHKTSEASVQMNEAPYEHKAGFSLGRDLKREKSNNKKLGQEEKDNVPQENQKEEGLFSLLERFVKKILEKLLGEDKKGIENTNNMEGAAKKNTLNNEMQQKSVNQSSYININGKEFNLEPGKSFNYQDKALNISIIYNSSETEQNLQQDATSPNVAHTINLNINGREYSIQPGESFKHTSPGPEISVVNGHQQGKHFDKVLSQGQSISEGLKQVTELKNPAITPVNTPKVNEVSAGRER